MRASADVGPNFFVIAALSLFLEASLALSLALGWSVWAGLVTAEEVRAEVLVATHVGLSEALPGLSGALRGRDRRPFYGREIPGGMLRGAEALAQQGRHRDAAAIYRVALGRVDFSAEDLSKVGISDRESYQITGGEGAQQAHKGLVTSLALAGDAEQALVAAEVFRGRILARIVEERGGGGGARGGALSMADVRALAAENDLHIVYYFNARERGVYIWCVGPAGTVTFAKSSLHEGRSADTVAEGERGSAALGRLAADARRALRGRAPPSDRAEAAARHRRWLRALHGLLIEPVEACLPRDPGRRVVLVPHGDLIMAPFNALLDGNGRYLINKHTLSVAPSLRVLRATLAGSRRDGGLDWTKLGGNEALVVGNPVMPRIPQWDERGTTLSPSPLPPLEGAAREARDVAAMFSTRPLLGRAATGREVVERMPRARLIHLATHGLLEDTPLLVHGMHSASLGADMAPGAVALAPERRETDEYDGGLPWGFLVSDDVAALKLRASLVVLSACDTVDGRLGGEDAANLPAAFIAAGARSVVMTLWSIPDSPTAWLMRRFYEELRRGGGKARALRAAVVATQARHPDPGDWAAFTLVGSPD